MANAIYTKGKEGFLDGSIHWTTDNIKALLVDTSLYTVNLATDQYLSDIPSGARVATSALLTGRTATGGIADADDASFPSVIGASVEAVVIFSDTGSAASSKLIAYLDTVTGLPFTPNNGSAVLSWANTTNKIFKL